MSVRIGLYGIAHLHALSYLACLRDMAGVEVAGVWDADAARLSMAEEQYGLRAFRDRNALLDRQLDGVVICSPNAHHRRDVEAVAERVPHILCEKPLATTVEDGQAMLDVCQAAGTRLQTAFPVRFAPAVQETKRMLDAGGLGQVYSASCTNQGSMPGGWFTEPSLSGGGAVIDHTVHVIDLLRWFWDTEVAEVYAEIGYGQFHPELRIDDAGLLSFQLANGVYGTLDTSWSRPPGHYVWGNVTLELIGAEGVLNVDAFRQHLTLTHGGRSRWQPWGASPDRALMEDFVDMIRSDREPSITGEDGLKALEVALAAYGSARTGQPVSLS